MRRWAMAVSLLGSLLGCASRAPGGDGLSPSGQPNALVDVTAPYRQLGRLAGAGQLPFVGSVAFVAGPGDSVIALIGLSLQSRAFAFQREDSGTFLARYRVTLSTDAAGVRPIELVREEVVRVASFAETQRTDESVLFQQSLRLAPGTYRVSVGIRDLGSTSEGYATGQYTTPSFGAGGTTAPILVYDAAEREALGDPLSLVLNPRGTAAYGADSLTVYLEGYDFAGPTTVPFEIRDDKGKAVYRDSVRFAGGQPVESHVQHVPPDRLTLGQVTLAVGPADAERQTTAIVSFSQTWLGTNFNDVIDMLRYFEDQERLGALRRASESERARAWRDFYQDTDPDPSTSENEALSSYFARVAAANQLFRDEGALGWQTDRGEVYITLGPPDEVAETPPGQARVARWTYYNYRLTLFFEDERGFGRLRLTSRSRSDFERAAARIRRRTS